MKKKSFAPYVVALILFISSLGFMIYSGLNEGSVYFLNVSEALAAPVEKESSMRLFGNVGSFTKSQANDSVEFILIDPEMPSKTMNVVFTGVVPDTFETGAEVILEGVRVNESDFHAKTLMTKCPSKYQKENRT